MTDTAREPDADRFDFYGAHYRRFGGGLAAALRREAYGEGDVGQTGWRTGDEQADIPGLLRLGPGAHVLDVACGAGGPSLDLAQRTGCRVTGLDIEPAGVARAEAEAAARGLADRVAFRALDCGGRLPFADGAFDAVLCVDAVVHLPDRFAALREWARLLRPGGRLLFADAAVLTGPVGKQELDARAANGAFLLVPPGCNEAAVAAAGLALLRREDRTETVAGIAGRWHAARAPRRRAGARGGRGLVRATPALPRSDSRAGCRPTSVALPLSRRETGRGHARKPPRRLTALPDGGRSAEVREAGRGPWRER